MKKTWVRVLLCVVAALVLVVGSASATVAIFGNRVDLDGEAEALVVSFRQFYGNEPELVRLSKPESIYVAYWVHDDSVHASLCVDGIWTEIVPPVPITGVAEGE